LGLFIAKEEIDHRRTLLEVLRENFGLLSTHKGCDERQFGACTVLGMETIKC